MRWINTLPLGLRSLFHKERAEQELDDEVRFHLEKQIEQNIAQGMPPEEARYAALRQFGPVEAINEECRQNRATCILETLFQDIRFGLRPLRRNPGFTMVAVLTLAICAGPRRRRNLRRHLLRHSPAHARDWYPHGAGGAEG